MRETALLISAFLLLNGRAGSDVSVSGTVPHPGASASIQAIWTAQIASIGQTAENPESHQSMTEQTRKKLNGILLQRQRSQKAVQAAVAPSPKVATLSPAIDQEDISLKHREIADQALRIMPKECQASLQRFYVRYDRPEHRGLAGKTTMILAGHVPDGEFRALFIHEFGHLLSLGCLEGDPGSGASAYKDGSNVIWNNSPAVSFFQISWANETTQRPGTQAEDFVSGYASWDMFEDFSESYAYYVLHRETFARRAAENDALKEKYRWFQQNLPDIPSVAKSRTRWDGTVPWDITKLPYDWYPPTDFLARR